MRLGLFLLILVLVLASTTQAADLRTDEITAPGSYRMTDDIASDAQGIVIRSGDVVLDGGGHLIRGSSRAGSVGILVEGPVSNVTVTNLTVRDRDVGVEAQALSGGQLAKIVASNCTENGIYLDRCRDVEVRDAVAERNAYPGIAINASDGCRIVASKSEENGDVGIYVTDSRGCAITGCLGGANRLNGVFIERSDSIVVAGCTLSGNGYPGIAVSGGRGVVIRDNLFSDNRLAAIWLDGPGASLVTANAATGSETGFVVRNCSTVPLSGGNLWFTAIGVDGPTRSVPSLIPLLGRALHEV
jgi:parallel beta-helix repeat protein